MKGSKIAFHVPINVIQLCRPYYGHIFFVLNCNMESHVLGFSPTPTIGTALKALQ